MSKKQTSEGSASGMKKCPKCQEEINSEAKKCKHCGADLRNWFVRHKVLTVILAFVVLAIIGSLGSGDGSNTQVYKMGEMFQASTSDFAWGVLEASDKGNTLKGNESRFPSITNDKTTSGKFIEVTFQVENKSNSLKSVTAPYLIDDQGREYTDSSYKYSEWIPEDMALYLLENLQPNLPKQFVTLYEVPADATGLKFKAGIIDPILIDLEL